MSKPSHEGPLAAFGFFDESPLESELSQRKESSFPAAHSQSQRYLTFGINAQKFCLAVERVLEVANSREISALPLPREHWAGYISVRGEALPVLDLGHMLGEGPEDLQHRRRHIIIVQMNDTSYAFPVEDLYRIVHIEDETFKPIDPKMFGDCTLVTHAAVASDESYLLMSIDRVLQAAA